MHNPNITMLGDIGAIKYLYPFIILLPFLKSGFKNFIQNYAAIIISFFFIFTFTLFRSAIGGDDIYVYTTFIAFVEIVILPYCLIRFFMVSKKNNLDIYNFLFILGALASIITFLCFINPSFDYFVRNYLQSVDVQLQEDLFRGFAISGESTYGYGVIQAMICSLWITKIENIKYKWFVLFVPFMILSILLNARVGLVILGIFVLLFLIIKHKVKYIIYTIPVIYIVIFFASQIDLYSINPATAKWLESYVDELFSGMNGDIQNSATLYTLTHRMAIFPESSFQWIFGRGVSLFGGNTISSDVGYILQLNYGGVIYVILLILLLMSMYKVQHRVLDKSIILLFVVAFLIGNFKGMFLLNSGGLRLLMLITIYFRERYSFQHYSKIA